MTRRTVLALTFILLACANGFGQTSYVGITPGESTRAEAEAVLGQPLRAVSKTLIEYKSPEKAGKVYVQYGDESAAARVERVELVCERRQNEPSPCWGLLLDMEKRLTLPHDGYIMDAKIMTSNALYPTKRITYYGGPLFVVSTDFTKTNTDYEYRLGFYSKELYEAGRPKGGCRGTIFGDWEAKLSTPQGERSLGLLTIERLDAYRFKGSYSAAKGSITGRFVPAEQRAGSGGGTRSATGTTIVLASYSAPQIKGVTIIGERFVGEWKDDANGSGTFEFQINVDWHKDFFDQTLRGKWRGTAGEVSFEARCLR